MNMNNYLSKKWPNSKPTKAYFKNIRSETKKRNQN